MKNYIVRSKLHQLKIDVGCGGCGNGRCQVCKNIKVTDTFDSFTTKVSYKINHKFHCNDKCLIFFFSCITCGKQYTGNTTDRFRHRWNNYRMEARKAESDDMKYVKQKVLQSNFLQNDHKGFLEDFRLDCLDFNLLVYYCYCDGHISSVLYRCVVSLRMIVTVSKCSFN